MRVIQVKILVNFIGSALTFVSIFLPWIGYSIGGTFSLVQAMDANLSVALIASGGIISLLSRYGGLLTMVGVWQFVAGPPLPILFVASNVMISYSFKTGVWLAWAGGTISLLGSSRTLPPGLMTTEENRKRFGMILFPLGVIATVFGSMFSWPASIILVIAGLVAVGAGIALFFPLLGNTLCQIFKGFASRSSSETKKKL